MKKSMQYDRAAAVRVSTRHPLHEASVSYTHAGHVMAKWRRIRALYHQLYICLFYHVEMAKDLLSAV